MKYLVVANGPFLPKSIILEAAKDAKIIALDGAVHQLIHLGIKPHIVLGDFDSINLPFKAPEITLIPIKDQNQTDLQKALKYALQQGATSIHIVCALGGRMDHNQANLCAIQNEYTKHCPIYLHSEYQTAWIAEDETIIIRGMRYDYCGLFGAPTATMSVKNGGLEYGGPEPYELSSQQYSSSNRIIGHDNAVVEITGRALIIHPPMLQAQRIFSQKSRAEQLAELLQELK